MAALRRAWVIEAAGKKSAFMHALKEADLGGDKVLATYGRLFDLPGDELGFDVKMLNTPDVSSQVSWVAKRQSQVIKLVELLSHIDEVVIATDTDLEGELIADQVQGLCQLANTDRSEALITSRVSVRSITPNGLLAAYEDREEISQNKVRAAKARRILDRLLGFSLHSPDDPWRLSIGRIVTPLVKSLQDSPAEAVVVRKRLADGWNAVIRVDARQAGNSDSLVGLLHGLPQPKILVNSSQTMSHEYKPLTGPEALKLCMRSLEAEPKAIQQSIQDNYEKGRLSYPRSDSRTLDAVGLAWVSRMAGREGVEYDESLASERQSEHLDRSYDAHNAVMPTGQDMPHSSIPSNYLSLDESVVRIIGNHSLRIGQSTEVFTRQRGELDPSDRISQKWHQALGRWTHSLKFIRDIDDMGFHQDPLRHELPRKPDVNQVAVTAWRHPAGQIVMERLMEIGLGRPSTLLGLAEKAYAAYLDDHGNVNGRGRIMIEKVMRRLPELLSHEAAQAIEHAVCDISKNSSIADRLSRAWEILKKNPLLLGESDGASMSSTVAKPPESGVYGPQSGQSRQFMDNYFDMY